MILPSEPFIDDALRAPGCILYNIVGRAPRRSSSRLAGDLSEDRSGAGSDHLRAGLFRERVPPFIHGLAMRTFDLVRRSDRAAGVGVISQSAVLADVRWMKNIALRPARFTGRFVRSETEPASSVDILNFSYAPGVVGLVALIAVVVFSAEEPPRVVVHGRVALGVQVHRHAVDVACRVARHEAREVRVVPATAHQAQPRVRVPVRPAGADGADAVACAIGDSGAARAVAHTFEQA